MVDGRHLDKKLSCRRDYAMLCFEHFDKSLKVIQNDILENSDVSIYKYSIVTMSVSPIVSQIFSVKWPARWLI